MHQYKLISKKGEGTFSEVLKAQSLKTGNFVAIKCMKQHFDSKEQVQRLREIQALKKISPHQHIIQLIEVLFDEPTGRLALVFELMDQNLYEAIRGRKTYLNQQKVKYYMYQLLKAIDHLHKKGIFHRDIKPENILMLGDHIKLADFGSCKGIYSQHPYTEYISTRWYRATECLLTDGYYGPKMDLWGVGCVMFEILSLFPLFPGNNELDQVHKIHNILGTPDPEMLERFQKQATHMEFNFPPKKGTGLESLVTHVSKDAIDLIYQLIQYDPDKRITAELALQHPYFRDLYELENNAFNNTLSHIKLSPQNNKYNRTLPESENVQNSTTKLDQANKKQHYLSQFKNSNNFNHTTKQNPLKDSQNENVFYPVLSIKKAAKQKLKKNKHHNHQHHNPNYQSLYPQWKVDLKIEGGYKDRDSEDEILHAGFLPPIQKTNQHIHMETKLNMYQGLGSTKYQNNPFKQTFQNNSKKKQNQQQQQQQQHHHHHPQHSNSNLNANIAGQNDYLVLGKKASYV